MKKKRKAKPVMAWECYAVLNKNGGAMVTGEHAFYGQQVYVFQSPIELNLPQQRHYRIAKVRITEV